jgi:hypothetical protein
VVCAIQKLFFFESSCKDDHAPLHAPRHGYTLWGGSSQVLRICCWRLLHVSSQPFTCFRLDMSTYARSFTLELCRARLSLLGTGVDLAMQSCLIKMFILFCLCCRDSQRAWTTARPSRASWSWTPTSKGRS